MRIDRLTANEAAEVAALFARSRAAAMPWLPVLHTAEEDRDFFRRTLADGVGMGAWDDAANPVLVGFAVVRPGHRDHEWPREPNWLDHLYVAPERRGEGVGGRLLDAVLADLSGQVCLWAFQRNRAARAFYRRRGFVEVEVTDGAGNEEREPDVLLRRPETDHARGPEGAR